MKNELSIVFGETQKEGTLWVEEQHQPCPKQTFFKSEIRRR